MKEFPAALEYDFGITGDRKSDGTWEVVVTNRGVNVIEDLQWRGRFFDAKGARPMGLPITLPAPAAWELTNPGLQVRLFRKKAVVWEWQTPGRTAPAWPLEPDQVRVPAKGLPPAAILAALAPVGSGSGRIAISPEAPASVKSPEEEGEDLVKLFESP